MNKNVSAEIIIYKAGQGIVLKEKTLMAVDKKASKILAIGNDVEKMDTNLDNIEVISPIHLGEIEDFACASRIMKALIRKALGTTFIKIPLVLCHPKSISAVALKAYEEAVYYTGRVKKVKLYAGSLNDYLQNASEKELGKYKAIIEIATEDNFEYARQLLSETYDRIKEWGLSKEQMLEIIENL